MFYLILIAYLIIASRAAGGGFWAEKLNKKGAIDDATGKDKGGIMPINLSMLPEVLFGAAFGAAFYFGTGSVIGALATTAWSYLWMETGHGTVLQWGHNPSAAQGTRKQRLTPLIDFIAKRQGWEIGGVEYCRAFMAVKGFLIALPVGGLVNAVLWPACYEIGNGRLKQQEVSEILAGLAAFVHIIIYLAIFRGY